MYKRQALDVGAALGRRDDVHEGAFDGVEVVRPAHGNIHVEATVDIGGGHRAVLVELRDGLHEVVAALQPQDVGDGFADGQEVHELADSALMRCV